MAQDQTQEDQVETTEEPKTETPKRNPIQTEFNAKGSPVQVQIAPIDGRSESEFPPKALEVEFGEYTTWREGEEGKTSGRFRVTYPRVIDGIEDHLRVLAVDPKKAIGMAIKQSGRGTEDDYQIDADFEDEFFKQRIAVEKPDAQDIWTASKFAENRDQLAAMRSDANEALVRADENLAGAQDDALEFSKLVMEAHKLVGGDRKALASWARGPKEGGSNLSAIYKLGKGENALYEAMRLAQLTDAEYSVLPASLTSGKGVDRHKALAIKALVKPMETEFKATYEYVHEKAGPIPNVEESAHLVRLIAEKGFKIEGATDADRWSLEELVQEVDDAAVKSAAEFNTEFGKSVNTYDSKAYNYALTVYGRIHASTDGASLFKSAVETLNTANNAETKAAKIAYLASLYLPKGNAMTRAAHQASYAHRQVVKREDQNRKLLKDVNLEEGPIGKQARTGFAKLDALPAAAHLFKLLCTHPKPEAVWDNMRSLVAQNELKEGKKQTEPTEPVEENEEA